MLYGTGKNSKDSSTYLFITKDDWTSLYDSILAGAAQSSTLTASNTKHTNMYTYSYSSLPAFELAVGLGGSAGA